MDKDTRDSNRFRELYEKYTRNAISNSELDELLDLAEDENVRMWIDGSLRDQWQDIQEKHPLPDSKKPGQNPGTNKRMFRIVWAAAATIAIAIAASVWLIPKDLGWEEYATGNGETLQVTLSDQSQVLLNANSSIRWNANWEKDQIREIELTGEAFFDIAHMPDIPLNVRSKSASIQVLGTSFNVREDVLGTDVYLHSGKIKLDLQTPSGEETSLVMNHGERIIKRAGSDNIEKYEQVGKNEAASWTEGELKFRDTPLKEILIRLEGIYGKQFVVRDTAMLNIPMDVGVPYANWEVMRSALELSLGVRMEEKDGIVNLIK